MFCFGAGCEVCTKPAKKKAKSATTASTKPAKAAETAGVTKPTPDIKAAMKSVAVSQVTEREEDERSMLDALVILEPILHPEDLEKIKPALDQHKSPAERWRWRREQR